MIQRFVTAEGLMRSLAAAALVLHLGCASSVPDRISLTYYFEGPEEMLRELDVVEVAPGDRALVELERAMALLELGRYEESNLALERAAAARGWSAAPPAATAAEGEPPWVPDGYERVLVGAAGGDRGGGRAALGPGRLRAGAGRRRRDGKPSRPAGPRRRGSSGGRGVGGGGRR